VFESLRGPLLKLLRVPPEPETPAGSIESSRVFRAGRNFYTWSLIRWCGIQTGAAFGILAGLIIFTPLLKHLGWPLWLWRCFLAFEAAGVASFLVQLPLTFFALRLGFEMRWYIVTDRSLRIRAGVWSVEELTMTFANIQQIAVAQGPLQRVLGIANVEVRSAGGSGGGKKPGEKKRDRHAGYFEGVEDAEHIRDVILDRLRLYRDGGLGDPDDAPTALAAAKQVLDEARLLRTAVSALE
jgi:membrane protein YdbS with pleckstrin-like domain